MNTCPDITEPFPDINPCTGKSVTYELSKTIVCGGAGRTPGKSMMMELMIDHYEKAGYIVERGDGVILVSKPNPPVINKTPDMSKMSTMLAATALVAAATPSPEPSRKQHTGKRMPRSHWERRQKKLRAQKASRKQNRMGKKVRS